MKKLIVIAVGMLAIHTAVDAQKEQQSQLKTRFGIHAGGVMSNMYFSSDYMTVSNKSVFGFQGGAVVDFPIKKHMSFQTGLNFIQKGLKAEDIKMTTNGLELPMHILYNSRGSKGNFFCGGGPSLSIFLSGKYKEGEEETKMNFGNDEMEDDLKQVDLGINVLAGYEFKNRIFLAVNSDYGLMNLVPGGGDLSVNSFYVGFRVGYYF